MLIDAERSQLLMIDIQDRLAPAMTSPQGVIDRSIVLWTGADRLGVPALVSEQYPRGLGPTVAALGDLVPKSQVYEKLHFSCARDPGLRAAIDGNRRSQIVIAGIESHVCVLQTALDLQAAGYQVFVAEDAVSSRRQGDVDMALARMRQAGLVVVSVEMVIFEWLKVAGSDAFKELSRLIK